MNLLIHLPSPALRGEGGEEGTFFDPSRCSMNLLIYFDLDEFLIHPQSSMSFQFISVNKKFMLELTDENFEREINNSQKPVLVDFFAEWCSPCFVLSPILEKLSKDFEEKFILVKANLDNFQLTAQKFGIDRIPTVILFKNGKIVGGFVGLHPEPIIKQWLEEKLKEGKEKNSLEKIIKAYEEYAKQNGFRLNSNREIVERIIRGLLENEKKYGQKYCPCRRVTGNTEEDKPKICPCLWHGEEIEKLGHCLCSLFIK